MWEVLSPGEKSSGGRYSGNMYSGTQVEGTETSRCVDAGERRAGL